jgi:hypothetical protein
VSQYRFPPKFTDGVVEGFKTASVWYRYMQALDGGQPPASETVVTPTASPFIYSAPRGGFVIVQSGTVGSIQFSRSGAFYATGETAGVFPVGQNDQLKITYSGVPKVTFVPL